MDIVDVKLLQNLLYPKKEEEDSSESDDEQRCLMKPRDVEPSESRKISATKTGEIPSTSNSYLKLIPVEEQNKPQTIEDWEQQEAEANESLLESRPRPEYKIVYQQEVTPEDVYLQMGNKTASTASCEKMRIEISMPLETVPIEQMQLDVARESIDLQTPKYRLKLSLMHPIDPDKGSAEWDKDKKVLVLSLRMTRELDFVNF